MIELSNFDLSSIIGKLNQGVTKTDSDQGSEFERILSAQLELSGTESGKEYPLLSQRGDSIGQKNSDEELSQLAIEGISDFATLVHSKVGGPLSRDNELVPSRIIGSREVGPIEFTNVRADRAGEMLPELSAVTEYAPEAVASKIVSPITFELQPADYFFDLEPTEKNQIAKLSRSGPEVLTLGSQVLLPEASIMKEIAEESDLTSKFVDGVRQSKNSPPANDRNAPVFEFKSPQVQPVANQKGTESGYELKARISPESLELSALDMEDPNTAAFYGDREGNSTEGVLVQSTPRRGEGLIKGKPALLGATPIVSQAIQESYRVTKIDPQSKLELAKAPASPLQELPRSVRGEKEDPAILDEPLVKVSQMATANEEGIIRSRPDGFTAAIAEMTRNDYSHERQPDGQAHRQGISVGHRSESIEPRNGPYIDTLSGQRQVLVGGRPAKHSMVDLADELEALARVDEAPAKSKLGRTNLSLSSTTRLAMTQESDLQSLKNQEGLAGLPQEAESQTRARLNKSRAAYSGIRQTGRAQAVDSKISSLDIAKNIFKAQEIENIPGSVKHEVISEASVGRISDILSPSSENRGSVRSTAAILQPADFIVPSAIEKDPALEGSANRAVSSSIKAELDLTGYESRRELLREELDKRVGQLIRSVSSQIKSGQTNELQIKLHPRELGIITFGVELLDGNDISVKILNASEEATKLVKEHWPSHWQDGGAKVSNLEAGDRAFSGNNSDPNSERKENRSGKGASEDGADSMKRVAEPDLAQGLAESAHNIDITI